ncbi:baseplate J/gp47 family protein [Chitinimonas naiadis]
MALNTKPFATIVSNTVAAIQGAASQLVDLSLGSILRAVVEAMAAQVVWLESLLLRVLAITRASTSSGTDLDSWLADYGFSRLPGAAASGVVTFSRFTATAQATIPVGVLVQTGDGSLQYLVLADSTNPAYSIAQGAYLVPAGTGSVGVLVQAVAIGSIYNVVANQINTLGSVIPGIDTVTNQSAFVTGTNPESDIAVRARFVQWVASLARATKSAIGFAVTQVQAGITYTLVENQTYGGAAQLGYFYVVVDDGTGSPSGTLIAAITGAVEAVRPFTVSYNVYSTIAVPLPVSLTLTVLSGYSKPTVAAAIQAAIAAYINGLGINAGLTYTRLVQIAYDASPGVANVSALLLNGATADIAANPVQSLRAGAITIN